jgi:transposase-like protein
MNTFRFSEEQRAIWVSEKYNGTKSVKRICKEAGISRATLYNWMKEFPKPEGAGEELQEDLLLLPESLTGYSKHDAGSKYEMLVTALAQVDPSGQVKKKLVRSLVKRFTLTVGQACTIVGIEEEVYGYKPRKPEVDDGLVYDELTRLINEDLTRGFIQCYEIIQQTHPEWTRKQLKRVYRDFRLYLKRSRVRRAKISKIETRPNRLLRPDTQWILGMINGNNLLNNENNNSYWILYVLDESDGKLLNATSGAGEPTEEDVLFFLSLAVDQNGKPRKLKVPGIAPFNTREMTKWMLEYKVGITTLSMAKPENELFFQAENEKVGRQFSQISETINEINIKYIIEQLIAKP